MPVGLYVDEWMLWLVALAFYVADNTKTIAEHEMILLEDWKLRWSFRLDRHPFLARSRHLYVLPLLLPYTLAVKLPWFRRGAPAGQGVSGYRRRLLQWRRRAALLRIVGVLSFLLLFIAAPLLTVRVGLFNTLLLLLPFHLALVAVASGWLCLRRRALNLRRWQTVGAIAEILLVPGYLPNIFRRTAWATLGGEADGIALLLRLARVKTAGDLTESARYRLSEDWLGVDGVLSKDTRIRAYRQELGI